MSMKVNNSFFYKNSLHSNDPIKKVPPVDTYNKPRSIVDGEETMVYEQKKNNELTESERNAVVEEIDRKETTMEPIDFYEMEKYKAELKKDILFKK